jgi:hypothetical protein
VYSAIFHGTLICAKVCTCAHACPRRVCCSAYASFCACVRRFVRTCACACMHELASMFLRVLHARAGCAALGAALLPGTRAVVGYPVCWSRIHNARRLCGRALQYF